MNHATNAAIGRNAHTKGRANRRAGRHGTVITPHATNAAIGRNAHTKGRANRRAGRHGTVITPHATTTAGPAQLTQYEAGGGSGPNEVNEPCGYTRG
uniref:hypothetical protein n=1 Tax=Rhodococcus opacus TaxID=37919 RepID=UPI0005C7372E|nr:hypothetical protein [Rhodococcus opacus]UDH01513.1 hypothetical protein K2Z90_008048 [Rhodococcus opacus PD630]